MVRRGLISRKEAIKKVEDYEGKFPTSYLDKPLEEILKKIDMTLDEFKLTLINLQIKKYSNAIKQMN